LRVIERRDEREKRKIASNYKVKILILESAKTLYEYEISLGIADW